MHGDTKAVFAYDPPKSVMDEIYEAEDTSGEMEQINNDDFPLGGKAGARPRLSRTKTRKDSFGAVAGLTEHLSDFLQEHSSSDISKRLEALEGATRRIERLLVKLGQDLGEDEKDVVPNLALIGNEAEIGDDKD